MVSGFHSESELLGSYARLFRVELRLPGASTSRAFIPSLRLWWAHLHLLSNLQTDSETEDSQAPFAFNTKRPADAEQDFGYRFRDGGGPIGPFCFHEKGLMDTHNFQHDEKESSENEVDASSTNPPQTTPGFKKLNTHYLELEDVIAFETSVAQTNSDGHTRRQEEQKHESFEVNTAAQNSDDSKRSSPSLPVRQLRLCLVSGNDSSILQNSRNKAVPIYAIATFQALHDYLRPPVAGLLSNCSRLSGIFAALPASGFAGITFRPGQTSPSGQRLEKQTAGAASTKNLPSAESQDNATISATAIQTLSEPPPAPLFKSNASFHMIRRDVYTVKFKKVPGPAPDPENDALQPNILRLLRVLRRLNTFEAE
ncbi:hypothetical protein BDN70DRAFT_966488 [Pholiota conissans]|uniref:Uncharacterized protein n=1 Tax=Pholiota conissans TaxID=109636 RepID=A0A9P5YQF6_9AGAR|nr:hypothetical protein BDN70DRAFT_966488 [Pholiota conissans]